MERRKPMCTAWGSSEFFRDWCLEWHVFETGCGTLVLWRDSYCEKLFKSVDSAVLEVNKWFCCFSKTVITAHTAKTRVTFLQDFFGNLIVEHGVWPLWSPDFTPHYFLLWGFIKEKSIAVTQEVWGTWNIMLKRLLLTVTKKIFEKLQKRL